MDLQEVAESGVKRALAAGAQAAELYVTRSRTTGVVASGPYVVPTANEIDGLGVRVSVGGRIGLAGVSAYDGIDRAIARALASAARAAAATSVEFPGPRPPAHAPAPPSEAGADEAQMDLLQGLMDAAQRRADVTYFQFILRRTEREVAVANSSGLCVLDRVHSGYVESEVRVTRGTTDRTARDSLAIDAGSFGGLDGEATVDALVEDARRALDPQPLARAHEKVMLAATPAAQLLKLLGNAFSGAMLAAGRNALDPAAPFSPLVTLWDDPRGRRAFDDEGVPARERRLVDAGVVVGHVHDLRSAQALGVEPTGNGLRAGPKSPAAAKPHRLSLAPGPHADEALLAELDEGVLITQPLLGSFASDKVTADLSVVAPFAFYVRQGKVQHALPPTAVGGNAHRVFRTVSAVGRTPRDTTPARCPAIVSGGVTCAT